VFLSRRCPPKAFHGDFFELRNSILEWCGPDDFTFFFIDPKGWKRVVDTNAYSTLAAAELGISYQFMYAFLLRTHTQESFSEDMQAIFGEVPDTERLTPIEKEEYLIGLYKKRLKEIAPAWRGKSELFLCRTLSHYRPNLYHLIYLHGTQRHNRVHGSFRTS